MIDYDQKVEKILKSIVTFSFEFDFETIKKEMVLKEVTKKEIEELGEDEIKKKFNSGIFKIQLPNGNLVDANSIAKHSADNNIKEPVIFINPDFKYVQWAIKKDIVTLQIKRYVKNRLTNSTDLNLSEVQKALVIVDTKNRKTEGYISDIPIKTSDLLIEGKFHIQSSCSTEIAIKMINEVIEELKIDLKEYIENKFKQDYKNIIVYLFFIAFVISLWFVNKQSILFPNWLSISIGFVLFIIPLFVMPFIRHSFFDALFYKKNASKKYETEFYNKQ